MRFYLEVGMTSLEEPSRKEVWKMFDSISPTYDRVNRLMTCGIDLYWRKVLASHLPQKQTLSLLDCATGTADQILSLMDRSKQIAEAIGIDLSTEMLRIGKEKVERKSYAPAVRLIEASATEIPFPEKRFDCVTMSFGIRNVTDVSLCLREIHRVLKAEGRALILESSLPSNRILRRLHLLYLRKFLPRIGSLVSKQKEAYVYLNQTIETFPHGKVFCDLMTGAGFSKATAYPLTGGIVTLYVAEK